jgi:ComEC/Rec2-related protein
MVVAALALIVGLTTGLHPWHFVFALVLLLILRTTRAALTIVAALFVGTVLAPRPVLPLTSDLPVRGSATVISMPVGQQAVLQYQSIRISAKFDEDLGLDLGDEIHIVGTVSPIPYPAGHAIMNRKVGFTRFRKGTCQVVSKGPAVGRWARAWRDAFRKFTERSLGADRAAYVDALCFSIPSVIPEEEYDDLIQTGTVHIISASGLHVVVFACVIGAILGVLPIPRPVQLTVLFAILGLYAIAAGLSAPIVRSVAMGSLGRVAYLVRREPDFLSALATAAVAILLWQPEQIYDIGFQLSFVTIASLGMGYFSAENHVVGAIVASLVATVASAPLVAFHFGTVPLLSVPANLLIEVPVSAVVGISMVAFPIGGSFLMQWLVAPCIDWIRTAVHAVSLVSTTSVMVPAFSSYWLLVVYVLAILMWRPRLVSA